MEEAIFSKHLGRVFITKVDFIAFSDGWTFNLKILSFHTSNIFYILLFGNFAQIYFYYAVFCINFGFVM